MIVQYVSAKEISISAGGTVQVIAILNSLKELDAEKKKMLLFI